MFAGTVFVTPAGRSGSFSVVVTAPSAATRTSSVYVSAPATPVSVVSSMPVAGSQTDQLRLASDTAPCPTVRYFALARPVRGTVKVSTPARRSFATSSTGTSANVRDAATDALSAVPSARPATTGSTTSISTVTVSPATEPLAARNTAV